MSVVWQADIFCNGPGGSGCKSSVGLDFIEQGETYWDSTKGAAAGAWEVAKANGWKLRRLPGRNIHLCPHCAALPE
ncbi:hypothetical protein [Pseudomonas sp. EMN2]|uniref:hypothetical protein n=1 Tax=Pseudomonas sp. EMN2 TaxID=2615212 RepID=UPI00129B5086|nr:hypothetical protein [Pseudomonas sp. EMN2]